MTSYKRDCDALKALVPLYVKGLLNEAQRKEIEEAIDECPSLREEIESWHAVQCAYHSIESSMPQPSGSLFDKIVERIEEPKKPGLLSRLFGSPTVSFVLVTAQLLLILSLGFYIVQERHEYKTMSAPPIITEDYIRINIIFNEQATESKIRDLLLKINGRIVDGPTRSGLYIVELKSRPEADSALKTLQKSVFVEMAEKAY
jgi:uncharacterized protein YneF (UPF0154 family)